MKSDRTIQRFFLLVTLAVAMAVPTTCAQTSPDLSRLIDALQAKYNRLGSLSADFTQIYTAPGERARRESGRLLLRKPGRMRWDYSEPERKQFFCDGRYVYEYVPADGFATRMSLKDADDWRAPFAFLLGRGDLRRDFQRIETASEAPARAGNVVLRLVPRETGSFRALIIEVDPTTLQLARLTFIDSDGARSDFLFSGIRENAPGDGFSPPAGVEIRKN